MAATEQKSKDTTEQKVLLALWRALVEQKPNLRKALVLFSEAETLTFYELRKSMGPRVHGTMTELAQLGLIAIKHTEVFRKTFLEKKMYGITDVGRLLIANESPALRAQIVEEMRKKRAGNADEVPDSEA